MKKPVLIVIAGANGSGKTSITSKILQQLPKKDCKIIEQQSDESKCKDEVKLALSQIEAGEARDFKSYIQRKTFSMS